jgi:rhodanese-related sulfurtransferase
MKKLIMTLAAALIAFTGISRADEYPDISIGDLKKAISEKKVVVIDVNGSDSYKAAHIPGAVDFESSKEKLATALPKDKGALVVAYCGGPKCSAYKSAAKAAVALGYTNVKHLSAGISGWTEAGEKTEKAKEEKKKEKGASTDAEKHTFVATFSGVVCASCESHVSAAIAKAGGSDVKFEKGAKEDTQKVTFVAAGACNKTAQANIVTALGDQAKSYVVQEVALVK